MSYYSPLRFPGGKHSYWRFLKSISKKDTNIDTFVEVFAGGAGLGLALLNNKLIKKLYINDSDPFIHAFWDEILTDPKGLIDLIKYTKPSVDEFITTKKVISEQLNRIELTNLKMAFSFFYINRTARSGIFKAGPIGGKKQSGEWKINARWNVDSLIKKINNIHQMKDKIELYNLDYKLLINKMLNGKYSNQTQRFMFFIDPPYYKMGKKLYLHYFQDDDHQQLAELLRSITKSHKWLVTYDKSDAIKMLYEFSKRNESGIRYSIHGRKQRKELIYFSERLKSNPGKHGYINIKSKRRKSPNFDSNAQYVL